VEADARRVIPDTERLIRQATDSLKLRDVVLFESRLFRAGAPPNLDEIVGLQQHKRGVRFTLGESSDAADSTQELHVIVSLGERVVDDAISDEPKVYFGIEADYLIIYDIVTEVSEDALKAFADYNSVHNVWPFWRQHVFDLVAQARLPRLEIALFSGNEP
jgi:hypothetical protein